MAGERKSSVPNGRLPLLEAYHRVLHDAQAARSHFFRNIISAAGRAVKDHICFQVQKLNISLCPLCC